MVVLMEHIDLDEIAKKFNMSHTDFLERNLKMRYLNRVKHLSPNDIASRPEFSHMNIKNVYRILASREYNGLEEYHADLLDKLFNE